MRKKTEALLEEQDLFQYRNERAVSRRMGCSAVLRLPAPLRPSLRASLLNRPPA
jgi:hypothetical protein